MKGTIAYILFFFMLGSNGCACRAPGTSGMFFGGPLLPLILLFFSTVGAVIVKIFYIPIKAFFVTCIKKMKKKDEE